VSLAKTPISQELSNLRPAAPERSRQIHTSIERRKEREIGRPGTYGTPLSDALGGNLCRRRVGFSGVVGGRGGPAGLGSRKCFGDGGDG
jgi:hypothetical protein